jgi:hypothetical protein
MSHRAFRRAVDPVSAPRRASLRSATRTSGPRRDRQAPNTMIGEVCLSRLSLRVDVLHVDHARPGHRLVTRRRGIKRADASSHCPRSRKDVEARRLPRLIRVRLEAQAEHGDGGALDGFGAGARREYPCGHGALAPIVRGDERHHDPRVDAGAASRLGECAGVLRVECPLEPGPNERKLRPMRSSRRMVFAISSSFAPARSRSRLSRR